MSHKKHPKKQKGVIALISILIISAITILLVLAMSEISTSTSYQYLNNSSNKIGYYAAEACLEEGLIRLEDNPTFTSATITLNADTTCTVMVSGGNTISITVNYLEYVQNFQAAVSITHSGQANNIQLLNWNEI